MGWLNCDGIPGQKTRRFQELNGFNGRCITCIGRADTDSRSETSANGLIQDGQFSWIPRSRGRMGWS